MPRKRWNPPPAAPSRPRMDCTCEEYVRQYKKSQEKAASSTLAQWEESHGHNPEASKAEQERVAREERKIRKEAEKAAKIASGEVTKKDKKKKKKKKEGKKAKKKEKKKKKKKEKKKKSSDSDDDSSGSSSSGSSSPSEEDEERRKKRKFEEAAKSSAKGWKISSFLQGGEDSEG
mmetsp:Transcript_23614/g.31881  ORF Transcript_23614/g.31881 Transcript_23614/m.31881 type:complete len:175 (+) Transcript_23614:58-582(+)